jgi:hypothetical protein
MRGPATAGKTESRSSPSSRRLLAVPGLGVTGSSRAAHGKNATELTIADRVTMDATLMPGSGEHLCGEVYSPGARPAAGRA